MESLSILEPDISSNYRQQFDNIKKIILLCDWEKVSLKVYYFLYRVNETAKPNKAKTNAKITIPTTKLL
jgi:hypothetical protein